MQSFSVFSSGFFSSELFVTQISQMTQIFFIGDFFHRISRNLFGGFLLRRLLTDFRGCDLSGRCRYPLRLEKVPQISQIYTDSGLVRSWEKCTQISQMTQIFLLEICVSLSHRFHRFTQILDMFGLWKKARRFRRFFCWRFVFFLSHRFHRFTQILDLFGLWKKTRRFRR